MFKPTVGENSTTDWSNLGTPISLLYYLFPAMASVCAVITCDVVLTSLTITIRRTKRALAFAELQFPARAVGAG